MGLQVSAILATAAAGLRNAMPSARRGPGAERFLQNGGEMGALMRSHDWGSSLLGPPEIWPQALRTAVRLILNTGYPMHIFWGADGLCLYNDAFRNTIGSERHPASLGRPAREVWSEVWFIVGPKIDQVMRGNGATWNENQLIPMTRNGVKEDVYLTCSYSPIDDEEAPTGIGGVLVVCSETTQQIIASQQLAASEERLQIALSAGGGVGTWDWNVKADRVVADGRFAKLHGVDPECALRGAPMDQFLKWVHPDDVPGLRQAMDECNAHGKTLSHEYRIVRPDGSIRWVLAQGSSIQDAEGLPVRFPGVSFDITARKLTEQKLHRLCECMEEEVAERTRERDRIWQSSPDLMAVVCPDGRFLRTNPAWKTLLGWTADELHEKTLHSLIHEDERAYFSAQLRYLVESQPSRFENRTRSKAGSYRWQQWAIVREGEHLYCVARDVDDARENEVALQSAQDALRQSQKMEAVGQLTGGLAHDFNNMLMGVSGSLEAMQHRIQNGRTDGLDKYMAIAMKSVQRAASLTHRLLAYSRRQTLDPRPTDINTLVMEMSEMIIRTVGPSIATEFICGLDTPHALIDSHQLENALLNLCINSRDAMPHGGRLIVETRCENLDGSAATALDVPPGHYAVLSVKDTGGGIPPEVLSRVFEPFFTTKPIGEGTGLGLSMVYGFARQSGGQIRIDSKLGEGTEMRLYLPRHGGEIEKETGSANPREMSLALSQKVVLVIDDEEAIRALIAEMLKDAGYTVLQAGDGASGLKCIESTDKLDLLITDVGLPGGLNGRQLADASRSKWPHVKVLFITGYAANTALGENLLKENMEVVMKPFSIALLSEKVQQMVYH